MSAVVERLEHGPFVELALNRPASFNAFDLELLTDLAGQLTALARDKSVRGVVVSGRGRAFCAGGDLKWVLDHPAGLGVGFHTLAGQFHLAVTEIRRMSKPVVAAVQGVAAGGGFSLALACDFRVMEKSAVLRQAYSSAGLTLDGGGSFTLPRLVGLARALEIAAFDEPISSEQALSWGLVTRVVEDGQALAGALELLERMKDNSLHAFGWSKRLLTDAFSRPFEAHIEVEREGLADCAVHGDGREGLEAFTQKRKPRFNS